MFNKIINYWFCIIDKMIKRLENVNILLYFCYIWKLDWDFISGMIWYLKENNFMNCYLLGIGIFVDFVVDLWNIIRLLVYKMINILKGVFIINKLIGCFNVME